MSRLNIETFRKLVRELIQQEIEEASTTSSAGGQYNTPHAFKGTNKKGTKKGKAGYEGGHEDPTIGTDNFEPKDPKLRKESVREARTINVEPNWEGMWRFFKQMAITNPRDWKRMERTLGSDWKKIDAMAKKHKWTESVNEEKKNSNNLYLEFTDAVQDFNDRCIEIADKITKLKGDKTDGKILMKNVKKHLIPLVKLMNSWNKGQQKNPHLTTEGRYHAWRNDDSMTPKQKIGMAMRETRDNLTELERVVKYNVKLKNELKVDSRDYWKTTHKALSKISERLVRLANKVGQLH